MNQILYSKKTADVAKLIAVVFCVLFILAIVVSVSFGLANKTNDKILKGVWVDGISVGGLTKEEAIAKVQEMLEELNSNEITLKLNEYEKKISGQNFGINFASNVVDTAYSYGRTGNLLSDNYTVLFSYFNQKLDIELGLKLDNSKYQNIINEIKEKVDTVEKDDTYVIENEKIVLQKGKSGYGINEEILQDEILSAIFTDGSIVNVPTTPREPIRIDIYKLYDEIYKEPVNASYGEVNGAFEVQKEVEGISFDKEKAKLDYMELEDGGSMEIALKVEIPSITVEGLNDILFKDILAKYTTKYDTSYSARVNNLQVAAKNINGTILYPGEEFSYNKVVGERTVANGFKEAHVFAGGEVVDGLRWRYMSSINYTL